MKIKQRKSVITYVVIPNDSEYSVQYCDTEHVAKLLAENYESGATVHLQEQYQDVIDRKNRITAMRGYKL